MSPEEQRDIAVGGILESLNDARYASDKEPIASEYFGVAFGMISLAYSLGLISVAERIRLGKLNLNAASHARKARAATQEPTHAA